MENKLLFDNISLVHFQLTKNCNLRCSFCGQWGNDGFFKNKQNQILPISKWKSLSDEIKKYCDDSNDSLPEIVLWGGEPLLYPHFNDLIIYLKKNGFKISIVTNGTLKDKFETVFNLLDKVYLSIDGNEKIHDSIRGKGTYNNVLNNFKNQKRNYKLIINSVLTKELLDLLLKGNNPFSAFNPDEVLLQDKIFLSNDEISDYKSIMREYFSLDCQDIDSWLGEKEKIYDNEITTIEKIMPNNFKIIRHTKNTNIDCKSVFNHIHINWNGNVNYCTDFYDFSAGNVQQENLFDIINNEKSLKFREIIKKHKCPTCDHCSWKHHKFT